MICLKSQRALQKSEKQGPICIILQNNDAEGLGGRREGERAGGGNGGRLCQPWGEEEGEREGLLEGRGKVKGRRSRGELRGRGIKGKREGEEDRKGGIGMGQRFQNLPSCQCVSKNNDMHKANLSLLCFL